MYDDSMESLIKRVSVVVLCLILSLGACFAVSSRGDGLFVANEYGISDDLTARIEFFKELSQHQKTTFDSFFALGNRLGGLSGRDREEVDDIKTLLFKEGRKAGDMGRLIVTEMKFLKKELFEYQQLIQKCQSLYERANAIVNPDS